MSIFSYSLFHTHCIEKIKFEVAFSYKDCMQFLLLTDYRLWHWISSFVWLIPTNLESVIFYSPTSHKTPIGVELKFYKVWNKKGSVKKRKTSNNESRVKQNNEWHWREGTEILVAIELQSFNAFLMLSMIHVYIKPEI